MTQEQPKPDDILAALQRSNSALADRTIDSVIFTALEYRNQRNLAKLAARHGSKILSGPFKEMAYGLKAAGSVVVPKLLGVYEAELHDALDRIVAEPYDTIINIGSAEGYYAVGLALLVPGSRVYAFDPDPKAQAYCRENAALNGVGDRIEIHGYCVAQNLRDAINGRTLIVCDCEGGEFELLDPTAVPALAQADMLVELHDAIRPADKITPTLVARFDRSHVIEHIAMRARDPYSVPALADFIQFDQMLSLCEFRGNSEAWAYFAARSV